MFLSVCKMCTLRQEGRFARGGGRSELCPLGRPQALRTKMPIEALNGSNPHCPIHACAVSGFSVIPRRRSPDAPGRPAASQLAQRRVCNRTFGAGRSGLRGARSRPSWLCPTLQGMAGQRGWAAASPALLGLSMPASHKGEAR